MVASHEPYNYLPQVARGDGRTTLVMVLSGRSPSLAAVKACVRGAKLPHCSWFAQQRMKELVVE